MDPAGTDPAATVEAVTYGGETVVEAIPLAGGTVGVTTHRVIALTPDAEGPTVQAAPRPNVDGVTETSAGDAAHGLRAVRFGVYAAALVGGSYLMRFDSFTSVDAPTNAAGAGQVVSMALAMTNVLSVVDDVLRIAGGVVLLVALAFAALYGLSRDRELQVTVAGADPLVVPLAPGEPAGAERLRAAVEKASNPPTR